ncbi:MAG: tRNA (adenine(22)-N(1))-methyltransferase [Erysipelotrichaceae bacterium]|jgi:tRNA (adenine22-N1)-methyltransferase
MISKRIREIADLIDNKHSFIDIGCDHGYLALMARKNGNESLIICSDNKKGPLSSAKKNLENYNNILFILSDGLKEINVQTDVAVLAGMGFQTVRKIILDSTDYFRKYQQIIIQINQNVPVLRRWLMKHNFRIINEKMIFEYKYYEIIVVENGTMSLNEEQIFFGPCLMVEKSETFRDYYHSQLEKINKIISGLYKNHPEKTKLKMKALKIKKMLED